MVKPATPVSFGCYQEEVSSSQEAVAGPPPRWDLPAAPLLNQASRRSALLTPARVLGGGDIDRRECRTRLASTRRVQRQCAPRSRDGVVAESLISTPALRIASRLKETTVVTMLCASRHTATCSRNTNGIRNLSAPTRTVSLPASRRSVYYTVDTLRSTTSSTSAENRTGWKTWRLESFGQVMAHTRNTPIRAVTIGRGRSFLR
jgi:hypothetical protein